MMFSPCIPWGVIGVVLVFSHTSNSQVWCRQPKCPQNAACLKHVTDGRHYCLCKDGYRLDRSGQCLDIDECAWAVCGPAGACVNTPGSYGCSNDRCGRGFKMSDSRCIDIDECDFPVCGPTGNCTNQQGSYKCQCYSGYQLSSHKLCWDVDECERKDTCDPNAICGNLPGAYECTCQDGFSGNGTYCADVDECGAPGLCDPNADCENLPGGYRCSCRDGYSGNGTQCADVDECITGKTCDTNADCSNHPGTYNCTCYDGFSGNGTSCADIDECNDGSPCHPDAICLNLPGSYNCSCLTGHTGNGSSCTALPTPASLLDDSVLIGVVAGSLVAGLVGLLVAIGLTLTVILAIRRQRERRDKGTQDGGLSLDTLPPREPDGSGLLLPNTGKCSKCRDSDIYLHPTGVQPDGNTADPEHSNLYFAI